MRTARDSPVGSAPEELTSERRLSSVSDAAERFAAEAGELLLDAYGHVSVREKGPADLVTEADFASQRLIAQRIDETFPDHTLLAEEEGRRRDRLRQALALGR